MTGLSILRPKHRACHRSGRPVIKIGVKGALGSHEIRPIHSAPSLGQSIVHIRKRYIKFLNGELDAEMIIYQTLEKMGSCRKVLGNRNKSFPKRRVPKKSLSLENTDTEL